MKYKFWVSSSRMAYKQEIVTLPDGLTEEEIEFEVEEWCEKVFPMFHYTDAFVRYGWFEIFTCSECGKDYELKSDKEIWKGRCPNCWIGEKARQTWDSQAF